MRVSQRKLPDEDETVGAKIMRGVGKVASLAATVYVGKKVGDGLSEVGKGLQEPKAHNDE